MRVACKVGLASLIVLGCAGIASAATVQPQKGIVSVNSGDGYKPILFAVNGGPGDKVIVGANGEALVVYSQTCVVKVKPGIIYTVLDGIPCVANVPPNGLVLDTTLVVAGIATAGVTGGVLLLSHANDHPASP